jgi:phosphoglycerate kinase
VSAIDRTSPAAGVSDARVVVRLDLNVPLDGRAIADDARLRAALPTLRGLAARRNQVLIVAHLGRPDGVDLSLSLAPVAAALSRLLGVDVPLVGRPDASSRAAREARIALRENIRFDPRETSPSAADRDALAAELRAGADVVVGDAFPVLHRHHATIVELVASGPSAAGALVASELERLAPLHAPAAPLVVIAGGTRVAEKVALLDRLTASHATVALGAQMAAALARLGAGDGIEAAAARRVLARESTVPPADVLVEDDGGRPRVVPFEDVRPGMRVIDLGPQACRRCAQLVRAAGTVVWNGPPGLQHEPAGRRGAETLARACAASTAVTIVGGGTTSMPLRRLGLADRVTHVSTGGTVLLQLLARRPIPGLDALDGARSWGPEPGAARSCCDSPSAGAAARRTAVRPDRAGRADPRAARTDRATRSDPDRLPGC